MYRSSSSFGYFFVSMEPALLAYSLSIVVNPVWELSFSYRQLITHLKVFAKFTNPRSLYLESSLSELYNQVIQYFTCT